MVKKQNLANRAEVSAVVTFFLGDEVELAVPVTSVYQILRNAAITRVPDVGHHIEGAVNLGGRVVPIIDVGHLLGLGCRTLGDDHRVVIIDHQGRLVGLSVDKVRGILQVDAGKPVTEAPAALVDTVGDRFLSGAVGHQGASVALLDLGQVIQTAQQDPDRSTAEGG
jgi:purine-binding chemotaxis protein CheW